MTYAWLGLAVPSLPVRPWPFRRRISRPAAGQRQQAQAGGGFRHGGACQHRTPQPRGGVARRRSGRLGYVAFYRQRFTLPALSRPHQSFHYEQPDLFDLAATYAHGLVKNHPFLDGNKRIGFMAAYTFLAIHGQQLEAPEEEAVLQTLALAVGEIGADEYAAWLRRSCTPR